VVCPFRLVQDLAKKGRSDERTQDFLWSADCVAHDPAAPLDAQAETADHRVSITKDVPVLRIDHVSIKGKLPGVWQALYRGGVFDVEEVIQRCVHVVPERT
jgi:hypothetical protein